MFTQSFLTLALAVLAEARFGQEHPTAVTEIQDVTTGGQPGQAATIAGGSISNLLAAANPCAKLQTGDNIIASLGTGADAVKAAKDFVAAEQNFNPFVQNIPTLCSDPTLPTTAILRGIVPLIDPAVGGAAAANKLSAQSLVTPFDAAGLSVADVFAAQGFSNFTTKDLAGTAGTPNAAASGPASVAASNSTVGAVSSAAAAASPASTPAVVDDAASADDECEADIPTTSAAAPAATTLATVVVPSASASATPFTNSTAAASGSSSGSASSVAGVDFGLCTPTIKFEGGLGGRPATEFTFQAIDPKISAIQEEALNPNIIANRICDELTNQCQSNQAAKDLCQTAKTQLAALTARDATTADAWNTALGFKGANTDPDGAAA